MNPYGAKAATYMIEHCPHRYGAIEDKEAYFDQIGEEAQRQVSSICSRVSRVSRPGLGEMDLATRQMAEETIHDLLYPPAEKGYEMGMEVELVDDI
jgi:hypothetical protein